VGDANSIIAAESICQLKLIGREQEAALGTTRYVSKPSCEYEYAFFLGISLFEIQALGTGGRAGHEWLAPKLGRNLL
jgi:hypothetical protein